MKHLTSEQQARLFELVRTDSRFQAVFSVGDGDYEYLFSLSCERRFFCGGRRLIRNVISPDGWFPCDDIPSEAVFVGFMLINV
jgi:hypothetical protein